MATVANMSPQLSIHSLIFMIQGYSMFYNLSYIDLQSNKTYGGRLKFLTFLNSVLILSLWGTIIGCLQVLYFGFCVLHDVVEPRQIGPDKPATDRSALQKFRDLFFASVMFPMGTFVVLTFWGIYAVNRELVYPKVLDNIIPSWLNHNMHTTVLVFLLAEMWLVYHHYPSKKLGLSSIMFVAMLYQVWILWIRYHGGFWVYPVLDALSLEGRMLFFGGLWVSMITIYLVGEALHCYFWGVKKRHQGAREMKMK